MTTRATDRRSASAAIIALTLGTTAAFAQQPTPATPVPGKEIDIMLLRGGGTAGVPVELPWPPSDMGMAFMAPPLGVAGDTVENAPYSAEAVTESVQTLADGNRIVHESRSTIHRDRAGRTRRELGLAVVGPLVGGGAPQGRNVQISDPQEGVSYMLDMENRKAFRTPMPRIRIAPARAGAGVIDNTFQIALPPPTAGAAQGQVFLQRTVGGFAAPVVEEPGTQVMEGVEVLGTRSTVAIPAGAIGNDLPISVLSERWHSPELKVLVLSRQRDPRFGETTYRLPNIVRSEPSADVFQVPPDFTLVDPQVNGNMIWRMEKKP